MLQNSVSCELCETVAQALDDMLESNSTEVRRGAGRSARSTLSVRACSCFSRPNFVFQNEITRKCSNL